MDEVNLNATFKRLHYINNTSSGILQIGSNGKVNKIVDRVADTTEFVNHFSPYEARFIPGITHHNGPAAKFLENFL